MKLVSLTLGTALLVSTVALSQQAMRGPNSGAMTTQSTSTDSAFVEALAQGDMAEVAAGKLAAQRGQTQGIKDFGQKMVTDHSKNDSELKTLAKARGVELPATVDEEHAGATAKLEDASSGKFDADYIHAQVKAHEKTVQLLENEIHHGQDSAVKEFAQKTLPVVSHHLAMAKELEGQVSDSRQSAR
jgi:putative membrane protein